MIIAQRSDSSIRVPQWMRQTMLLFLFSLSTLFGVEQALACQAQVLMLGNPNLTVEQGKTVTMAMKFVGEPQPENYVVFVHLVSATGTQFPGGDHSPSVPTSTWTGPVNYNHDWTVPTSMPVGTYTIRVGLYQGAAPYGRVALNPGPGVAADAENRYTVGTLVVKAPASTPVPAPTPAPIPAPAPAPAPVPPAISYNLTITAPAAGATVSGSIQVKGTGPGFKNVEVLSASGSLLGRATPDASGNFSATVDTTKLANGSQTVSIYAWDSAAGQPFTHTDNKNLSLNVQNAGAPTPPPSSGTPVGGPGGYTRIVMNDSFGSSKAGANITSLGQFNQGTYGRSGSGWDDHMCAWDCGKANLSMASEYLEIRPTGGPSGFISSRFEWLPTGSERVYYEIRAAVGRGDYQGGQTWPAFWLFAGNEPGSNNTQSEIDIMETYMSQQWGPYDPAAGGYSQHFVATIHPNANSSTDSWNMNTPGVDITTTMNTYGCEVWKDGNGKLQIAIYFNGKFMGQSSQGINWTATPPSLFLGWNPGSTSWSPAVMKVDYVKAWVK